MMLSAALFRQVPSVAAAVSSLAPSFAGASSANLCRTWAQDQNKNQRQQLRWVTKKRQHRMAKRKRKEELAAKGIFPPKPHMYIPRDSPVLNSVSKEERDADSKRQDEIAALELKARMELVQEPLMRFGFDQDLVMSDRVRKLLATSNGNQKEVVKTQKQRGMQIFQLREGDTGSSAVQGTYHASREVLFLRSILAVEVNLSFLLHASVQLLH